MSARSAYRVFIGNLPWTISKRELKEFFSRFGHVQSSIVAFDRENGLNKGYGFITFSTKDAFLNATKDATQILEGSLVRVQPALAGRISEDGNGF